MLTNELGELKKVFQRVTAIECVFVDAVEAAWYGNLGDVVAVLKGAFLNLGYRIGNHHCAGFAARTGNQMLAVGCVKYAVSAL